MTEKGSKILIKSKKVSFHGATKTCNFSCVRDIRCIFIAIGLKIIGICMKIYVLWVLREVRHSLHVVQCEGGPDDFINVLGQFSVTLLL